MEVLLENGESLFETDQILKWQETDYSHFYASNCSSSFNNQFILYDICNVKCELGKEPSHSTPGKNEM